MSRIKHLPLAALAAVSLLLATTAVPDVAVAQKRDHQAQADRGGDRSARMSRAQADRRVITTRHNVRTVRHVTVRHRDRFVVRNTAVVAVPFVVLGSPVVYRAYGPGWCRALHRGHHWAPGLGWHAGRHVGRVRC